MMHFFIYVSDVMSRYHTSSAVQFAYCLPSFLRFRMGVHDVVNVGVGFTASMVSLGFIYSLGNLFNDIVTTFNVSRTEAGTVQSIAMAFGLSSGKWTG